MVGTILHVGSSVEYQALLAEIKQKDKQREELLMNLKVRLYVTLSLNKKKNMYRVSIEL